MCGFGKYAEWVGRVKRIICSIRRGVYAIVGSMYKIIGIDVYWTVDIRQHQVNLSEYDDVVASNGM